MWRIYFIVALLQNAHAQDAWTRRRNQIRPQNGEPEIDPSIYGNFAQMNAMAENFDRTGRRDRAYGGVNAELSELMRSLGGDQSGLEEMMKSFDGDGMAELMKQFSGADMQKLMSEGIGMWGEMLESPAMQEMLNNPDQMREAMAPFVKMMGGDEQKFEELLADPGKIKETIAKGVKDIQDVLSDPSKLEEINKEIRSQMDDDSLAKLERLASGDMSVLSEAMSELQPFMSEIEDMLKDSKPEELQAKLLELMGGGNADMASILGGAGGAGLNVGNFEQKAS